MLAKCLLFFEVMIFLNFEKTRWRRQDIFYLATESKAKEQNPKTKRTNEKELLVETDRPVPYINRNP